MTHNIPLVEAERLRLYGLDDALCADIRRHQAFIMSLLPEVLERFYQRISEFEEARRFFRDEAHIDHMKTVQTRHWQRLTEGNFNDEYAQRVMRIGEIHFNVNVPPKLYIAFYNILLLELADQITAHYAQTFPDAAPDNQFTLMKNLTRVLMYDMECAITVYVERSNSIFI